LLATVASCSNQQFNNDSAISQVKLEVDVKTGNNPKVIATDEAKSIGAYHVVLDK